MKDLLEQLEALRQELDRIIENVRKEIPQEPPTIPQQMD